MGQERYVPRLTIFRELPREQAEMLIQIMLTMEEVPTFTVERTGKAGEVRVWMSKRTYDYAMARLPEQVAYHEEMV